MNGNGREAGKMASFEWLSSKSLKPELTDDLFIHHEKLFVEICTRWMSEQVAPELEIAAYGRILPLAPHLAEHAERLIASPQLPFFGAQHTAIKRRDVNDVAEHELCQALLGAFRLLSFDCRSFAKHLRLTAVEQLFQHPNRVIRYMAVRNFCLYVHAADHAIQEMLKRVVGEEEVEGEWEGKTIDYRFLALWEEKRWKELQTRLQHERTQQSESFSSLLSRQLSPYTVNIGGVLLPRLDGAPSKERPLDLVSTPTTDSNLQSIAQALLGHSPLLLTGLAGSGKTLLTRYLAWQLNKLDTMVTLHLNEQSDAKLLVGMYATGAKPGTFSWRPGVLTTAVREGRWIFIEDLDRAPNEVISTLLPLIERGELLIPSRGQTIRASRGFRIIATMRSTLNPRGQEIVPRQNMIGHRFWKSVTVHMPELAEFESIIKDKFPAVGKHIAGIMRVYARLLELYSDAKFSSENGTSLRALTPRDLLKWCDRIAILLSQSSSFSDSQKDDIFMEAFDCFAGSLRSEQARARVMSCVAEELHIDPQRRDHLLHNRDVKLEAPAKSTASGTLRIGRARLARYKVAKRNTPSRPFSTNGYTLRLLEKIAVSVDRQEPLLLVGETGTGKTTCIQYLAEQLGRKLVAFNLSQQSESGDLLGGYKPVNVRSLVIPLKDEFDQLFDATFSRKKNQRFIEMLGKRVAKGNWKGVCNLWREALKMVDAARKTHESRTSSPDPDGGQPKKKRKVDTLPATFLAPRWDKFAMDLHDLEAQLANGSEAFALSFLEGNIVKAVRNGDWVLLDEINLASSDTLEALADLLGSGPDGSPSILLTETGNVERIVAHPNFRVFAAMNPATDVGKKDLPPGIRSRFTELYVESPDSDKKSLQNIVEKYLGGDTVDPTIVRVASDVTKLYLKIQELARANMLVDGADQKAHFSLRTLTRTLSYAREIAPLCTIRRALFEGFHMSFLTFLGKASEDLVAPLIREHLFPQKSVMKAELGKPLLQPSDGRGYVRQGHYWLRQGLQPVEEQPHYIITPFVQRNMNNLIRASSTRRYPVLIQGPTSSGKTSMIEYLAKRSGNKFVRINNHEHTDLQEYLGSYISGADGKLVFQEGILVRALREGHWIVLDELNLAPTDVLEALNRLLDDNRELLIPETQEVVRPHEDFMLFATQNPAGLYGGRKALSRAFRNRFLELHFDDIPVEELTEILHRRTMIPESWCKRIVSVYQELSILRQENRIFEQKSFATLRDLFRWAQRKADTIQDLANNGYMLLAERVRKEEERVAVKNIIETVMSKKGPRVTVDEEQMFSEHGSPEIQLCQKTAGVDASVVWTRAMRRLFVLVAHAIRNNEPVLLVGETGCGKTTVCQMLADAFGKQLHIVNAHQNTETGDLIGAQRPIRNRAAVEDLLYRQLQEALGPHLRLPEIAPGLVDLVEAYDRFLAEQPDALQLIPLAHREEIQANRIKAAALFEWADGSLVHSMKTGQYFLLDEISLADDSVLERLNSVLESSRTLLLAEKGPVDSLITANEGFQFLATMNPGGDYGKKELSPALRNRFTEIWVPAMSDTDDIEEIIRSKMKSSAMQHAGSLVKFSQWFNQKYNTSAASSISIRDTLAWVTFINASPDDDPIFGIVHGAAMVFIDTLGANPAGLLAISAASIDEERRSCLRKLSELLGEDVNPAYYGSNQVSSTAETFQLGSFSIQKVAQTSTEDLSFSLEAPTTRSNATRVLRALQLSKPILLEGNPGVGKTTLVTAIARAIGKPLTRLNLSEQTDLMDLFGSDVPVEGGQAGTFAWRDAPFLKAMKNGDWVLLDEMNLASQSVLEGLNAVLDHRGEVYISELDQTFHKHSNFRVFAAQNPHHQGGGRKGLPASFVNRFTVVYADVFRPEDLSLICRKVFPNIEEDEIKKLIAFVAELDEQVVARRAFGNLGAPWEFNLRDTLRWLQLLTSGNFSGTARDFLDTIFAQRFRSETDRSKLLKLFEAVYGPHKQRITLHHTLSPSTLLVGLGQLSRADNTTRPDAITAIRTGQLPPLEALVISVQQNWPVIIVGPSGSGKTSILNQLASFAGANMVTFSMNADIDAMDLVGGYEQVDPSRELHRFMATLEEFARSSLAGLQTPEQEKTRLLEILCNFTPANVPDILNILRLLAQAHPGETGLSQAVHQLQALVDAPQQIDGARFQWVDGILIQALEEGKWLVLDNANLCSSAVLDRLNSLLEPNGYLSINEHSTADGEARLVRPHPNFRIFMTMDPRFGELSRAMRNRAVEICLLGELEDSTAESSTMVYPLESRMYRFRELCKSHDGDLMQPRLENLSPIDTAMLRSFRKQVARGLVTITSDTTMTASNNNGKTGTETEDMHDQLAFLGTVADMQMKSLQEQTHSEDIFQTSIALQSYHPLNNELYLHRHAHTELVSNWYSSLYEMSYASFNMQKALTTLPSTKFERRKELQKLPAFLYAFAKSIGERIEAIRQQTGTEVTPLETLTPKLLRQLFWAFHSLITAPTFDRATFQTYLKMLSDVTIRLAGMSDPINSRLSNALNKEMAKFGSEVQLNSGLGMERVWIHFKPDTPKTQAQLDAVLALEGLADRLDAIMWKSRLGIDEMIQIRERFASSLELVRTRDIEAGEFVTALGNAVAELEASVGEEDATVTPYFEDVFEGISQHLDIAQNRIQMSDSKPIAHSAAMPVVRAKSSLLARRPTKLASIADQSQEYESARRKVDRLMRYIGLHKQSGSQVAIEGRLHAAILEKLHGADEVQLAQLHRFEAEIQVLAQELVLDSERLTSHQQGALCDLYRRVLDGLYASHQVDVIVRADANAIEFNPTASIPESHRQALEPLKQCFRYAGSSHTIDSRAWTLLALTGLMLYVPNYPHDPALRPMIERHLFNEEKSGLLHSLQMLRQFQVSFTGQDTSYRIRQTEETIREMGEEPPVPAIVRPLEPELDALQGEFSNLLSVIHPLVIGSLSIREAANDQTLKQNISHIMRRLTEGYRSYDDITGPAVGFLTCLVIGLSLGANEQEDESNVSRSLAYLTNTTPFFGFHDKNGCGVRSEFLTQRCEEELGQNRHAVDLRWHAVHSLAVIKSIDSPSLSNELHRRLVNDIFASLYGDWKTQLVKDQQEEAKNTSLYTYRGEEEEEEEDRSLFPDYESEDSSEAQQPTTSREHVVQLAKMHALIFLDANSAAEAVKALLNWCAEEMSRVAGGKAHGTKHELTLPAIYLALEKRSDALFSSSQGKSYDFYFDANLPEAKRMMSLIHRIQVRYRQIRNVWPEHATLSEVLRTCDEALAFRHVDPLAKLITKLEKLYGYMYEWQRVASKEFSTAPLFDDLTSLLVSWRQLELTTWSRLFDMETEKCHDNARSWFFVAYETIIAAAESIDEENGMKQFIKDLLKTLEGFFYATTLGQYEQRINLLRQLHAHIVMRTQHVELFRPLATALANFISYFSRLQKPVREALAKGRQTLEKDVNNVIKLASWKDTNIEALKQSAKTSHRKLSKLVRKFRAMLNQPVSGIVKAGFSEESASIISIESEAVGTAVPPTALELCNKSVPAWENRPTRFKNLAITVTMMRKMAVPSTEALDAATYIESFITDLETQVVELQKATPTVLTEENKMNVQHLKTRKRKLYADTMKELRQMGVKANLSTDLLARQDELSTVLALLPTIEIDQGASSELYLYKALSIMEQVRAVAKEHHGDLTGNDVMRSIGYLEGLLHVSIRQRGLLKKASKTLVQLQIPMKKAVQLSGLHEQNVLRLSDSRSEAASTVKLSISWLCAMLDTGVEIVAAQSKLGKTNELDTLRQEMKSWSGQLRDSFDAFNKLPTLPSSVWSEAHVELEQHIKVQLDDFRGAFSSWVYRFPISRTVLQHLEAFLFAYPEFTADITVTEQDTTLETLSKEMLSALDLILGSMQDVESALQDLPTSTEDAAWLNREEETLTRAINALHASQVDIRITALLDSIHSLADDHNLQIVAALLATVQPIFHQYSASHSSLVARLAALHTSTAKLLHRLSKSFIQVGAQGFCQPSEKSADQDDKSKDEKLEEGTGLGAGEGAEDISKDIEDDEDLEDLAQEKGEREGSIEDQEDAVDMGEQDMEGETGETTEKEDKGEEEGEEGEDDVQSEVGSVDDLGPSAVDEKMWDEGGKEDDLKDKDTKEDVGTENQDEQVAADQNQKPEQDGKQEEKEEKEGGEEEEEMEMEGEDQEENVGMGDTEQMDPHAKEEETLDLPDELNIDGNEDDDKGDNGDDDMDLDDNLPEEDMDADNAPQPDMVDEEVGPEQEGEEEKDTTGHVEDEEMKEDNEEEQDGEEPMDDDAVPLPDQNAPEDESRDAKDDHQTDPNAEAGAGADANEEAHQNQQEQASASAANREDGAEGESAEQQQETTAEDGTLGQTTQPDAGGRAEQSQESPETQSFKKLGDVLERWYNQQKQISDARQEKDETQVQQIDKEVDMANAEFEHLQDENEQADTQALGTATEEQAKALDHDMAMAVDEEETTAARPEDVDETQNVSQDVDMQDSEPPKQEENEPQQQSTTDGRPQAFIGEQNPFANQEDAAMDDALPLEDDISDTSSVEQVENKLDLVHLDDNPALAPESARALWLSHESSTHSLSQQLTESLRLILAPTLATKLRGDFRTGKRLNLKRIIPYIASSYKRDKIWLRRSLPSKRSYQVMIALDDSKSMAESGASNLALKTLTLVARSMAMLEVGEVAVTGFGDNINVAHDFDKPFTSEAGVRVFEQFGFNQQKTDVRGLVHKSLDLFAEARRKGSSSAGEDLWQLMLIVSDGICDSHAEIQRLIRRAQEERVMIVFVIIDSAASTPAAKQDEAGAAEAKKEEKKGIMDLQSVEISAEGKVVRWKYMERFPFRYFLVVRDVRELPGVLAGALRQWFGEVVGSV